MHWKIWRLFLWHSTFIATGFNFAVHYPRSCDNSVLKKKFIETLSHIVAVITAVRDFILFEFCFCIMPTCC